jgi:hypothetical protein
MMILPINLEPWMKAMRIPTLRATVHQSIGWGILFPQAGRSLAVALLGSTFDGSMALVIDESCQVVVAC